MAQQQINVGTSANDGTGDTLRASFVISNSNATDAEPRLLKADTATQPGDNVSTLVNDAGYISSTLEFTVLTADGEMTAEKSSYDVAVNGTGVFTLPAPTAGLNGVRRGMWRTGAFSATDYISITGNLDGNAAGERRMGLSDEYFKFVCDGTTWLEEGHSTQAFVTPIVTAPTTFALTTGFTKLTSWDTLPVFATPGRLLWNSATNQIDVPVVESLVQDGYKVNLIIILEYTNNRTVTGIIAIDGVPINGEFPINALGSGKPLMLLIPIDIGFAAGASNMEVQLKGEVSGTLDILSARWTVNRIKG